MQPNQVDRIDAGLDVAIDCAQTRITCGHCRREPATHALIAWCGAPINRRITELVCKGCGDYSLGLGSSFLGHAQMYRVQLSEPQAEAVHHAA